MLTTLAGVMWFIVQLYFRAGVRVVHARTALSWPDILLSTLAVTLLWTATAPLTIGAAERVTGTQTNRLRNLAWLVFLGIALTLLSPIFRLSVHDFADVRSALRFGVTPQALTNGVLAILFGYLLVAFDETSSLRRRRNELRVQLSGLRADQFRVSAAARVLFGRLDGVANVVREQPQKGEATIVAFASLLRTLMSFARQEALPVEYELELIDRFVTASGGTVRLRADDDVLSATVPPLIVFAVVATFASDSSSISIDARGVSPRRVTFRLTIPADGARLSQQEAIAVASSFRQHCPALCELDVQWGDSDSTIDLLLACGRRSEGSRTCRRAAE